MSKPANARKPWVVRYWTESGKQRETSFRTQLEACDAKDKMLSGSSARRVVAIALQACAHAHCVAEMDSPCR